MQINPKFKSLIPPLEPEELKQLEVNILADGCREPLVIWRGILLDGHNRYGICQRHNIEFKTVAVELPDEEAAMDWMDKNQLGRRNLPPHVLSVIRGRIYNRRKKKHGNEGGDDDRRKGLSAQSEHLKTVDIVAQETGVSRETIKRDAKLAAEVAADPELQAAFFDKQEFKLVRRARREARRETRRKVNAKKIESEPKAAIQAKFSTIVLAQFDAC